MRAPLQIVTVILAWLVAPWAPTLASDEPADGDLAALTRLVATRLDPRVVEAVGRIDGTGPRLLALRSYLRSRAHLGERWSWTQEQIAAFDGSPEHAALWHEIGLVQAQFAKENPGYELWVNPQVRSLDVQVESWNRSESVAAASANLLAAAGAFVGSKDFPRRSEAMAADALERFLVAQVPEPTPTVAAPGLSPHGQMRAIDFQVQKDDQIVAGPKTATIAADWDEAGWAARLDAAVRTSSTRFVGPLASPREPWHYTYTPDTVAAQ